MVFQDPTGALNPRQTIYESVAEGLRIHKVDGDEEQLVAGALSRSGLRPPEQFFLRYPHEISGGQRQRVVIAGAMALEPALLVADEPVASLDASVRGEILRLMLGLVQQTNIAMLVVTHDLGLAWNVADRVAVMYLGRDRGGRSDGTGARVPEAPVHRSAVVGRARDQADGPADPPGRATGPDPRSRRLPVPSPLPGVRERRSRLAGHRGEVRHRGSEADLGRPPPRRRMPQERPVSQLPAPRPRVPEFVSGRWGA